LGDPLGVGVIRWGWGEWKGEFSGGLGALTLDQKF
jgi:hypothetical protein